MMSRWVRNVVLLEQKNAYISFVYKFLEKLKLSMLIISKNIIALNIENNYKEKCQIKAICYDMCSLFTAEFIKA